MADVTTSADMAKLLDAHQLERLKDISVGELIFVVQGVRQTAADEESSEDEGGEDEGEEGEGDEGNEDEDEEQQAAASASENGNGEPDEVDNAHAEDEVSGEIETGEEEDGSTATEANHQDDENPDEQNDEAGEEDEDETADTVSDTSAAPTVVPTPPRMFVVTNIIGGDGGNVKDIHLQQLTYSKVVNNNTPHTYQIYGNDISFRHSPAKCNACKDPVSITIILADPLSVPLTSPKGDYVRRVDLTIATNSSRRCVSGCKHGWLKDRRTVNSLIAGHDSPVLAWDGDLDNMPLERAVCPICVGPEYLKEQENLQNILLTTGHVDIGPVLNYQADLNVRRSAAGYQFVQFDERLWGLSFGDMDDDEDGGDGGMDGGWADPYEHFPEALDPNAYIKLNPASEATIKALPRKTFGETGRKTGKCDVCMEPISQDAMIIELHCGHSEHHAECLETWLRQQETCTVCRRVVPAAKVMDEFVDEQDMKADMAQEENETATQEVDARDLHPGFPHPGNHAAVANRQMPELLSSASWVTVDEDEDTVMSDV